MPLPNFLIIGVPKSGSTSLQSYLNQHPEIYLASQTPPDYIREPDFFSGYQEDGGFKLTIALSKMSPKPVTMSAYLDLFSGATSETAIGEGSFYLYSDNARKMIKKFIPDCKFIIILRNPADRAYSHFLHRRLRGIEPHVDFEQAISVRLIFEADYGDSEFDYTLAGFYYNKIKNYFDTFAKDQFKIILYDNWKDNNELILKEIFEFLNVDPNVNIDTSKKLNTRAEAKIEVLNRFIYSRSRFKNCIKKVLRPVLPKNTISLWANMIKVPNRKPAEEMNPEIRSKLIKIYRQDILNLEQLIGQDLSPWLR